MHIAATAPHPIEKRYIVSPNKNAIEVIFLGYIIPFFSWNWIMGFTVYLHHTHPNIPWYNSEEEWKLRKLQVYYSARITLPEPFQTLYSITHIR